MNRCRPGIGGRLAGSKSLTDRLMAIDPKRKLARSESRRSTFQVRGAPLAARPVVAEGRNELDRHVRRHSRCSLVWSIAIDRNDQISTQLDGWLNQVVDGEAGHRKQIL